MVCDCANEMQDVTQVQISTAQTEEIEQTKARKKTFHLHIASSISVSRDLMICQRKPNHLLLGLVDDRLNYMVMTTVYECIVRGVL